MKKLIEKASQTFDKLKNQKENKDPSDDAYEIAFRKSTPDRIAIEIPTITIVKVLFVVGLFYMLGYVFYEIRNILIISFISFFIAMGLSPIVSSIEKYKIPRVLAILILYLLFFGVMGVLFVKVIPIIAEQINQLAKEFDIIKIIFGDTLKELRSFQQQIQLSTESSAGGFNFDEISRWISENFDQIKSALNVTSGIFANVVGGLVNFLFALVLIFFILLERESVGKFFLSLFPIKEQKYIAEKTISIQKKVAEWIRGQMILMVSMGLFMYAGMKGFEILFGMKYAATIGLLAAVMELFPFLGVLFTGLLAVVIAVNIDWFLVAIVCCWIALAQFLEGNVLVPLIMEKVVGLSSVAVILALAIGGILGSSIGGVAMSIVGMILAVPITASIAIFVEEYAHRGKSK